MPALTNVDVVRALLWLGMRGVPIADRVIAFALEEDFSAAPPCHPYAVACALLNAVDEALVCIENERRPPPREPQLPMNHLLLERPSHPGGRAQGGRG